MLVENFHRRKGVDKDEEKAKLTDSAMVVHSFNGGLKGLTTDVLVVNVNSIGSQTGQGVTGLLLLVVEASVKAESLGDVLELLVVTNTANDLESFVLGQLADNLANGTAGGRNEDGLALLGLANLVERAPGGKTGHAKSTNEVRGVQAEGVLDVLDALSLLGVKGSVLLDGKHADNDVTWLELGVVALQDLADDTVVDGLVQLERGEVGLDLGIPHTAALVGVQGCIVVLEGDAAGRGSSIDVKTAVLDGEVNAGLGNASGRVLEDEALVLNHFGSLR